MEDMHSSDKIQTMEGPLLGRRKGGENDILIYMKSGCHIWEKRETGHRSTLSLWMIRKGDLQERADNSRHPGGDGHKGCNLPREKHGVELCKYPWCCVPKDINEIFYF